MNKKGFTLVEVLAIIVILGVIMLVVAPSIFNITQNSKQKANKDLMKTIENAGNLYVAAHLSAMQTAVSQNRVYTIQLQTLMDEGFLTTKLKNPITNATIDATKKINVYLSNLSASGDASSQSLTVCYEDNSCSLPTTSQFYDNSGANSPDLASNMIPVRWNGSNWITVDRYNRLLTSSGNNKWYNYDAKEWANAVIVTSSKKGYYQNADLGTVVSMSDILTFWVWIPRYVYKIPTANWHTSTAGTIAINFSLNTDDTEGGTVTVNTDPSSNASNNTWSNEPAFTFGSTEVRGIWVAKFEPSAAEGIENGYMSDNSCPIYGDNVTTKTLILKPGVMSWRCVSIDNSYIISKNIENNTIYGWSPPGVGIDTHLMKNTEWGATTYLTQSTYGKNGAVTINSDNNYTTGGGIDAAYVTNVAQSTTGNIYGIYDMSGGTWERVAAYVDNGSSSLTIYGKQILNADAKYKDVYANQMPENQSNNYNLSINRKGEAVYEISTNSSTTSSWYGNYSAFPTTTAPFFLRGGGYSGTSIAGLYYFNSAMGNSQNMHGFRPVLLVNAGL